MLTPDEVTIAALANVVRMLCEELVAGQHSNNIDIIDECAARSNSMSPLTARRRKFWLRA